MNRHWLTQVNYGLGRGSGSHNDPYKVLSVVDGGTGLVTGDRYVGEARPDSRTRQSLFWQNKIHLTEDVIDVSYRYYRDNWGVRAHTLDARYRYEFGGGVHIEPHARVYRQGAADFWRGWLVEGQQWSSITQTAAVAIRVGRFAPGRVHRHHPGRQARHADRTRQRGDAARRNLPSKAGHAGAGTGRAANAGHCAHAEGHHVAAGLFVHVLKWHPA